MKLILTHHLYKAIGKCAPQEISRVVCAKNETARFVAVVQTQGASRLVCDNSPSLALTPVKRYRLAVDSPFDSEISPIGYLKDNSGVKVSDIIMSGTSCDYFGDELPLAAVDLSFPQSVKAGKYKVTVKLYESVNLNDETLVDEKPLLLDIKDCALPEPPFGMYVDLWQHNSNIARYYGVKLWSDAHFGKFAQILDKLRAIGQKSVTVVASDCPWRGWGCNLVRDTPANLFEYNIISVTRDKSGAFSYDFSALDKLIKLYFDYGIDGDITVYGLLGIWSMPYFDTANVDYPEAVKISYTDCQGARKFMTDRAQILDYFAALVAHFKALGVWDKVRIGADEPKNVALFNENLQLLKNVASDVKLKIAIDNPDVLRAIGSQCDDLCLSFPCTVETYKSPVKAKRKLWYVCNIPDSPNTALDNSLAETVALGALNRMFGFDGFLRWAFTCWTNHPLEDIRYNVNGLPAGDVCLVFPSKSGGVWESVRYRALRFAIMLNELLSRVETNRETYNKLLSSVVGMNSEFYFITENLGISTEATDYLDLYENLLTYFENKGGAV